MTRIILVSNEVLNALNQIGLKYKLRDDLESNIEVIDEDLNALNQLGIKYKLRNDLETISLSGSDSLTKDSKTESLKNSDKSRTDLENSSKQVADLDRKNWIVMPYEFTNGEYSLEFDPARLSYNPAVEKVGKELDLILKNTSKDSLGREFIGKVNWSNFLKINLALGNKTPNTKEFVDAGRLLYRGMNGNIKVYNVAGKQLDQKFLEQIFSDIYKVKSPSRAEWLDADFKLKGEDLYLNYNHILDSERNLIPNNPEILDKKTLMENRIPGISLEDWLENSTKQGLPHNKIKLGDLCYLQPKRDNNSVAWFFASSGRAFLGCDRYSSVGDSYLGVRAVRQVNP